MPKKRRYKVLILEDEEIFSLPLETCINQSEDFVVMDITGSATTAYQLVKAGLPDVVIADLQLDKGEGDGMLFLQQLYDTKNKLKVVPFTLAVTNNSSERTKKRLNAGLADAFISKKTVGYGPEMVLNYLRTMEMTFACNDKDSNIEEVDLLSKSEVMQKRVEAEMDNYCIKYGTDARRYLIHSICYALSLPANKKLKLNDIIQDLTDKYKKNFNNLNVSMNRAIQKAFEETDINELGKLYKPYYNGKRGAPSVLEFISYTRDKIKEEKLF